MECKEAAHKWSVVLMVVLILIIFVNYLIIPILGFFKVVPLIQIPRELWNLFEIAIPTHLLHVHLPTALDKFTKPTTDSKQEE